MVGITRGAASDAGELKGLKVSMVEAGDVGVVHWGDQGPGAPVDEASLAVVRRFMGVQYRVWSKVEMVPFRFGVPYEGRETRAEVGGDVEKWRRLLDEVGGCAEIAIDMPSVKSRLGAAGEGAQDDPSRGRTYLQRRRESLRGSKAQRRAIGEWLTDRGVVLRQIRWVRHAEEWVVLVERAELRRAIDGLADRDEWSYRGPFPPWSFAG